MHTHVHVLRVDSGVLRVQAGAHSMLPVAAGGVRLAASGVSRHAPTYTGAHVAVKVQWPGVRASLALNVAAPRALVVQPRALGRVKQDMRLWTDSPAQQQCWRPGWLQLQHCTCHTCLQAC